MTHYIGIDLGKFNSYFVVQNEHGQNLMEGKVINDANEIHRFLKPFVESPCEAVIEATCNYYWMYNELKNMNIKTILAHPLKTRAIADAKIKNDRLDARTLATLLRARLIPESYIPSEDIRALREMTRQHIRLTQIRTRVKNQGHALLVKLNLKPIDNVTDIFGKKGRDWLRSVPMDPVFAFQRDQILDQIERYNTLIQSVDWKIEVMLRRFPSSVSLRSIPGVGKLAAAILLAEIGDIHRFPSPKQLAGYAGIVPGLYASGQTFHSRGITHQGNKFLRWILCEITQHHIQKPGALRTFYLRLKMKKGHGKAIVASARKFLTLVYYTLKKEEAAPLALTG